VNVSDLADPIFIAKIIDFIIFVAVLVYLWNRFGSPILAAQQDAENKTIEDAAAYREESAKALTDAQQSLEKAKSDAVRMVDVGTAQATRLVASERAAAEEHGKRIRAHAGSELERERYRVRRELLEETVDKAHAKAKDLVKRELNPAKQQQLIGQLIDVMERTSGD
jgi:F0F1-type ATP synthase membrane subunit b/b'